MHVVANVKQALKAEEVGCDAIVGEGVEAGGHNGGDEITTLCLIPQLVDAVKIPVIGLGGIMSSADAIEFILAGATAIQVGTANFIDPQISIKIIQGIENYLVRHNISDVKDLIGALKV